MDANFFLSLRLDMIAQFYELGSAPFRSTMQQIEDGVPPYEPPYTEDGEPPFELAYNKANDSVVLLGAVSISLLAGALQVFLDTMVKLYCSQVEFKQTRTSTGWWGKHQNYFKALGLDFVMSGTDLALLSEIVLARNSVMHQEFLTISTAVYRDSDLEQIKTPFFISETEAKVLESFDDGEEDSFLFAPTIHVDQPKLVTAIAEVRLLTGWLEKAIWEKLRN
jgi:hypothetical protein